MPRPESVTTSMRAVLVVVALLVVLGSIPRVASAQAGVIDACVQQAQGLTRIVGATEACRQNEIHVQWNVVGPKGDPGPAGPQGPAAVSASAAALGGTWTGRIFSLGRAFNLPYVYTGQPGGGQNGNINVPLQPPATREYFWNIPAAPMGVTCGTSGSCAISWINQNVGVGTQPPPGFSVTRFNLVTEAVDPNHQNDPSFNTRLAETSSLSASLQLTATGSTVTGRVLDESGLVEIGSIDGVAVSNEFFVLRILIPHSDDNPACPPARMQAFASIRTDLPGGPRLNITGSGGTPGAPSVCEPHHDFFSGGFRPL